MNEWTDESVSGNIYRRGLVPQMMAGPCSEILEASAVIRNGGYLKRMVLFVCSGLLFLFLRQGLTLSPTLECPGEIIAHGSLDLPQANLPPQPAEELGLQARTPTPS